MLGMKIRGLPGRGAFLLNLTSAAWAAVMRSIIMGQSSKNARTTSATQKFFCSSCGGEVRMKTLFEGGKFKNIAECEKCKRTERRPSDFK
jgi:hypothetical protein